MPYQDDTDRFCPVCKGRRKLRDTSTHDYGYSAYGSTPCWACYVPAAPEAAPLGPDALMDAALGDARAAWDAMTFAEYHGGR